MESSSEKSKEATAVPHGAQPSGIFPQVGPVVSNGQSQVFKYPPQAPPNAVALALQMMQQMQQSGTSSNPAVPSVAPAVPFVPANATANGTPTPKLEFDAGSALLQIMHAMQTQQNGNADTSHNTSVSASPVNFTTNLDATSQIPAPTTTAPVPPQAPNPQQILMAQTHAQAAAILAGVNPALLLNAGAAPANPTTPLVPASAAQTFTALMQQQQQQQTKPQPSQPPAGTNMEQKPAHQPPPKAGQPSISINHIQPQTPSQYPIPNTSQRYPPAPDATTALPSPFGHQQAGIIAAAQVAANSPHVLAQMQNWKLSQLESHVRLLREANQSIPQSVSLLLAEARRREEKRTAKRVANRKSACTSRARKKALVEDLTRTNARLKRQAMILSLLPDLVIAVKIDGDITFCSQQVERVLRRGVDSLVGEKISSILTPSSHESLARLIGAMVAAERAAYLDEGHKEVDESGGSTSNSGGNASPAAIVSEQSEQGFPLSVVKVKSLNMNSSVRDESSEASGGSGGATKILSRSTTSSSFGNTRNGDSNSQGCGSGNQTKRPHALPVENGKSSPTTGKGDDSSSSSDTKNLRRANESLDRNVRSHNAQMNKNDKIKADGSSHKDDVTGASVTPNNAGARLSSLWHNPQSKSTNDTSSGKKSFEEDDCSSSSTDSMLGGVEDKRSKAQVGNTSEDSGYRESGESVPSTEDTSSFANDASNNASRPRPLAPTCNVCIIREDNTTIWCEVTSSIRTRSLENESHSPSASGSLSNSDKNSSSKDQKDSKNGVNSTHGSQVDEVKELLLCLRPIREGGDKFKHDIHFESSPTSRINGASKTCSSDNTPISDQSKKRPMKKRPHASTTQGSSINEKNSVQCKKQNVAVEKESADKKIALESLILMSGHSK